MAEHDRRSILWRYSPGNLSFHPPGYSVDTDSFEFGGAPDWSSNHRHRWPEEWMDGLSEAGRAVLEPAYASFRADIGRPLLDAHGELTRDTSDCRFRKAATDYDRKPGIKWLSCTAD